MIKATNHMRRVFHMGDCTIKHMAQIGIYVALVYALISIVGSAHDRGYVEGCKDTRAALSEYLEALAVAHTAEER